MKLDVPYYSQHTDVKDETWRRHSCAIVCVYMVLAYAKSKKGEEGQMPTIDDLIYEGFELRGTGSYGWTHDALVWLLHNHGVPGYREEFKSIDENVAKDFTEVGLRKIGEMLKEGNPVIVSGIKKWKEDKKFHNFVLTGFEEEAGELVGFYYHDPDDDPKTSDPNSATLPDADISRDTERTREPDVRTKRPKTSGANLFVDIKTFKEKWRKLAIFVY